MSLSSFSTAIPTILRKAGTLSPPDWVQQLSGLASGVFSQQCDGFSIGVRRTKAFARVSVRIHDAVSLAPATLLDLTRESYNRIFETLAIAPTASPIRFWSFLPRIHDLIDEEQSRYMVFNAGRFLAFQDQYGDSRVFDRNVATASAVGHHGRDLWIHCFASSEPGIHVGNPRQVSPHRYSARFGRLPPCFARATLLPRRSLLLIGGTASICGEDSLHDDVEGQLRETLANLAAVVEAGSCQLLAEADLRGPGSRTVRGGAPLSDSDPLQTLTDVRIYHPRSADLRLLHHRLRAHLGDRARLEFLCADLCRPELLVEVEATADLGSDLSEGALR